MNEIERLIVRRIAVKMKQRQCRYRAHGKRIGQRPGRGNSRLPPAAQQLVDKAWISESPADRAGLSLDP